MMTIQVYTHSEQEEKALLEFLNSRSYSYESTDETENADFLIRYNKELDEAEKDMDAGNYVSHDDVKKHFAQRRDRRSGN